MKSKDAFVPKNRIGKLGVTPCTQSHGSLAFEVIERSPGYLRLETIADRHGSGGMQISINELKKLVQTGSPMLSELHDPTEVSPKPGDEALIKAVTADVMAMPDREDRLAELRARIEAGTYNPTSDEIAEAMIRRSIADRVR